MMLRKLKKKKDEGRSLWHHLHKNNSLDRNLFQLPKFIVPKSISTFKNVYGGWMEVVQKKPKTREEDKHLQLRRWLRSLYPGPDTMVQ